MKERLYGNLELDRLSYINDTPDESRYPFSSPFLDLETTDPAHIQLLIDKTIKYDADGTLSCFDIHVCVEGERRVDIKPATVFSEVPYETLKHNLFQERTLRTNCCKSCVNIYFTRQYDHRTYFGPCSLITQDLARSENIVCLSKTNFLDLLESNSIPPKFIEAATDNNGFTAAYTSPSSKSVDTGDECFHMFIKHPRQPVINSAVYFQFNLVTGQAKYVILTNQSKLLFDRIARLVRSKRQAKSFATDPLFLMGIVFEQFSTMMEASRNALDIRVRKHEARTGMTAHKYSESLLATPDMFGDLNRSLHVLEQHLLFFKRSCSAQLDILAFLKNSSKLLRESEDRLRQQQHPLDEITGRKRLSVLNSNFSRTIDMIASPSRFRFNQVQDLHGRAQIQLSVTRNLVTQHDTKTNIRIADESARIAAETRRDSTAMKTIAALTMVFLPGTFVAVRIDVFIPLATRQDKRIQADPTQQTLFSMSFFHVDGSDKTTFAIDRHWWLYIAVTIPLTILVVSAWLGWLKWKSLDDEKKRQRKDEEDMEERKERVDLLPESGIHMGLKSG